MQAIPGKFVGGYVGTNSPSLGRLGQHIAEDAEDLMLGHGDVLVAMEQGRHLGLMATARVVRNAGVSREYGAETTPRVCLLIPGLGQLGEMVADFPLQAP